MTRLAPTLLPIAAQSFPTPPAVLDDFSRPNESPPAGWTVTAGDPQVISNELGVTIVTAVAVWSRPMPSPNVAAYFTISVPPTSGNQVGIRVRRNPGVTNGYSLRAIFGSPNFITMDNLTVEISAVAKTMSAGDSVGIAAIGSKISSWYKSVSGGTWQLVAEVDDATIPGTGDDNKLAVVWIGDAAARIDNFGGGVVNVGQSFHPRPVRADH